MSSLLKRSITGLLFVIVMIGGMLWHPVSCLVLFGLITTLSLWEFMQLKRSEQPPVSPMITIPAVAGGLFIYLTVNLIHLKGLAVSGYSLIGLPVLVLFLMALFRRHDHPMDTIGKQMLGYVYVVLPFTLANVMVNTPEGFRPTTLIGVFILIWTNDTMAYLVGSRFGKHKLFERISPKKTWEGTIGGVFFCLLVSHVLGIYFSPPEPVAWYVMGILVSVFGTYGDLIESMFKRSLGIKDSGHLLPGHGGLLDRFDAFIFCLPWVFICLKLFF